jgi:hypothetical protein
MIEGLGAEADGAVDKPLLPVRTLLILVLAIAVALLAGVAAAAAAWSAAVAVAGSRAALFAAFAAGCSVGPMVLLVGLLQLHRLVR